ncbi:MAG: HEAT repeat domain-containing protein, partial [Planctomycetaceae bacterium]|nr:HEAT repeat domain-containing protein [Planctomycetaceae bacterium]
DSKDSAQPDSPEQKSQTTNKQSVEATARNQDSWPINTLHDFFIRPDSQHTQSGATQYSENITRLKQLSTQDSLAGWNAAILWATLSPATAGEIIPILEKIAFDHPTADPLKNKKTPDQQPIDFFSFQDLKKAAQDKAKLTPLSPAMKHAAINGLSLVLSHADAIPLETKNRLTQSLLRPDLSLKFRSELYCGLARFMSPSKIPTLEQSLEVGDNKSRLPRTLRRTALDACIIHGLWFYADLNQFTVQNPSQTKYHKFQSSAWPANIMQLRWDSDSLMRSSLGYWAAVVRHPEAEGILTSQLRDADIQVQNKAIEHLGLLGTETALELLKEQMKRPQESSRIAAALGLSHWGAQYLAPLSKDESASVRLAVSKGLGQNPSPEAALLLRSLIDDSSTNVQTEVIDSISLWPDELAIPLLLEGIQEGVYKTRRKSIIQLTNRTGTSGSISIEAPRAERIAAVRELVQSAELPGSLWNQLIQSGLQKTGEVNQSRAAEIQAYFQELINQPGESTQYQHAYQELANITPPELTILEKLILETSIEIPNEIYTDLLPDLDSNYAALNQLT